MAELKIQTARVFAPLLKGGRYLGAHGGRGSGKSRFFSSLMIEEHLYHPGHRSVCIREVQKSLKDSAKRLLEDTLKEYSLRDRLGFKIWSDRIETPGDGIILFQGMNDQNSESIKSLEGVNRAWVEEGQTLSSKSLQLLRPTIRAPGSQIWVSWNPRRKNDPVDMLLRGESLPTDAVVVQANWSDNPWFPPELDAERQDDLRLYPDQYPHIWEGEYITVSSNAYYARELNQARSEGRICIVAPDPLLRYRTFWDIGGTGLKADACAIWVAQFSGREVRVIDYYEAVGQPLSAHVQWLMEQGYAQHNTEIYLPHDGTTHDRVYAVTYESELKRAGYSVTTIKNQGVGAARLRIEATRKLFPSVYLHSVKCQAGIDCLGWYHERVDDARNVGLGPVHDWSSHAADSFGMLAMAADDIFAERPVGSRRPAPSSGGSWMG